MSRFKDVGYAIIKRKAAVMLIVHQRLVLPIAEKNIIIIIMIIK